MDERYKLPEEPVAFKGTLVKKYWGKNKNIVLWFLTDDGKRHLLSVKLVSQKTHKYYQQYTPLSARLSIDFKHQEIGSRWMIFTKKTNKGFIVIEQCVPIDVDASNNM